MQKYNPPTTAVLSITPANAPAALALLTAALVLRPEGNSSGPDDIFAGEYDSPH